MHWHVPPQCGCLRKEFVAKTAFVGSLVEMQLSYVVLEMSDTGELLVAKFADQILPGHPFQDIFRSGPLVCCTQVRDSQGTDHLHQLSMHFYQHLFRLGRSWARSSSSRGVTRASGGSWLGSLLPSGIFLPWKGSVLCEKGLPGLEHGRIISMEPVTPHSLCLLALKPNVHQQVLFILLLALKCGPLACNKKEIFLYM